MYRTRTKAREYVPAALAAPAFAKYAKVVYFGRAHGAVFWEKYHEGRFHRSGSHG